MLATCWQKERDNVKTNVMSWAKTAPAKLQARVDCTPADQLGQISKELIALTQAAAFAGEYVAQRHGEGCGDQGHAKAAEEARTLLVRVRRVLGCSYPNSGVPTI